MVVAAGGNEGGAGCPTAVMVKVTGQSPDTAKAAESAGATAAKANPRRLAKNFECGFECCMTRPLQTSVVLHLLHVPGAWRRGLIGEKSALSVILIFGTMVRMKRAHLKTLALVFARPTSANIKWKALESLFLELGAEISEREGSRIAVVLFGVVRVFHRPHPSPDTDKGAVAAVRKWLEQHGVEP